jgi:hypothetical protein
LIDVVIHRVRRGIELTEIVAVGEIDVPVLARTHDQVMGESLRIDLIRQQERST